MDESETTEKLNLDDLNEVIFVSGGEAGVDFDDIEVWPSQISAQEHGIDWIHSFSPIRKTRRVPLPTKSQIASCMGTWSQSTREVQSIAKAFQLAYKYGILAGKWLINAPSLTIDRLWERIVECENRKWQAKVSTRKAGENTHVMCVYTENFMDLEDVFKCESDLRDLGFKGRLAYKPDVFTYLNIYRGNEFGIRPTIYVSQYCLLEKRSRIDIDPSVKSAIENALNGPDSDHLNEAT
eukprot:TRINITY_DN26467_c0_g1_i6.p1 TRINITY_DN26467_c0_g1~~TRINITY_DN26467_c0_g1_i6.p1  ORF type:complete len:238 (-),score=20.19 TRINITY_DN26467_c0_g1_i6:207-920(-)